MAPIVPKASIKDADKYIKGFLLLLMGGVISFALTNLVFSKNDQVGGLRKALSQKDTIIFKLQTELQSEREKGRVQALYYSEYFRKQDSASRAALTDPAINYLKAYKKKIEP